MFDSPFEPIIYYAPIHAKPFSALTQRGNYNEGEVNRFMLIRPGMAIQISMVTDTGKTIYPRAMVYDIEDKKVIFSQTSPPLLRSHIGRYLLISSVLNKEGKPQRYGFLARITGFIKDYEIASQARVMAVSADVKSAETEVDLRESFRVKPFADCGLLLVTNKEEYPIVDISLGGVLFSQPFSKISINPKGDLPIILVIDEAPIKLLVRVIRVVEKEDYRFVAVAFSGGDKELQSKLGKKILDIERQQLSLGRL